jgi:putative flippase GtrA
MSVLARIKEFVRYFAASALALGVDFSLYVGGVKYLGLHYLVSAVIGFLSGLAVVYLLSIRWVFAHRSIGRSWKKEFVLFTVVGILGMLLNEAILYMGVDWLSFDYRLAKVASAGIVFTFNFSVRKLLLFTPVAKHVGK